MTSEELVNLLEESRRDLTAAVTSVPESHVGVRPSPGRWSAIDCLEHVTFVEERFLSRLREATPAAEPRIDEPREGALAVTIADRSRRADAPEVARPVNRFSTLGDALASFHQARSSTVEFATARYSDLYALTVQHGRFGALNGVELMVILAGHARRHAEQIRETATA